MDDLGPKEEFHVGLTGDFEILIGSDPVCRVCIPNVPGISPQHAALKRVGDRLFLKDCGSAQGTYLNGERLRPGQWVEVTRYDDIAVCGRTIEIGPKLFFGRPRLSLETSELFYVLPRRNRVVCDGVYLRAKPGTFTAIMGPSGSGKTILLKLLNGELTPRRGRILVGREIDLHADYKRVRDFLGYVPQEDVMIPELTVRQSLSYRLSLKFPDMASRVRDRLIYETCGRLGFAESKVDEFLDTRIGSPESGYKGLSGGERKRANIAHELVTKPLILLLDEPTSGLSSADAEQIVQLLHDLARYDNLTVVASIHQPSRDSFAQFDDLLLLTHGGQLVYYGKAKEAVDYFQAATGNNCGARNPAEYVLSFLRDSRWAGELTARFVTARSELRHVPKPLPARVGVPDLTAERSDRARPRYASPLHQLVILTRRNFRVLWADLADLGMLFGQVPLIAALMLLAFLGSTNHTRTEDRFARMVFHFHRLAEPYRKRWGSVPVDALLRQARALGEQTPELITRGTAQRRGTIHFVLVAASIWFGLFGACKEVVSEQHILRRESRSCVRLLPYLGAKALTTMLLVGVQTGLLVAITAPTLLNLGRGAALSLWAVAWLAAAAATALGLFISCAARTRRLALTVVPLILIPQLLFGGLLRPHREFEAAGLVPRAISGATIQRWAFEASLRVDAATQDNVLQQHVQLPTLKRYSEMDVVRFTRTCFANVFFRERDKRHASLLPEACLIGQTVLFLAAGYVVLRWRFLTG